VRRNHSCTSSWDPALSATCMLEAYAEWPLAGGRRLWVDSADAGRLQLMMAVLGRFGGVPWFAGMPRGSVL